MLKVIKAFYQFLFKNKIFFIKWFIIVINLITNLSTRPFSTIIELIDTDTTNNEKKNILEQDKWDTKTTIIVAVGGILLLCGVTASIYCIYIIITWGGGDPGSSSEVINAAQTLNFYNEIDSNEIDYNEIESLFSPEDEKRFWDAYLKNEQDNKS